MATVATPAVTSRALDWRMWVPCLGMALCSWLSFVDRQVLGSLTPTIVKETGMSAREFADVNAYFFFAYTFANPIWGSILDSIGLRAGMLLAVGLWTAASISHAGMSTVLGFALARGLLGLGEGATFPGGLRTAVESLPTDRRGRAIALSFSGGTLGGVAAPLIAVPVALKYGWRSAFLVTGGLGLIWMTLWAIIARPPFLMPGAPKAKKLSWPNPFERRFWALVFSYALPAIAPGPILSVIPLYLSAAAGVGGLGVSQAELGHILWAPPLAWGVGYFFWGWAADRYAAENQRPVGMFLLLTLCSVAFGFTTWTSSVTLAIVIISWGAFIGGGFQMVALKVGAYTYPREQAALMSGIASGSWALVNYVLLKFLGPLFDQHRYTEVFWLITALPAVGIAIWLVLSRNQAELA
jgi:ACS family hexuronate transporter-like MFS transporter